MQNLSPSLLPSQFDSSAVVFLRTCFRSDDWVALFLKHYGTGQVAQCVGPLAWASATRTQRWLRTMNERGFNVYVGVNGIKQGCRARTRDAVGAIRHVFVEADHDGAEVLRTVEARTDLPSPSYMLHTSPDRVHIFWRANGFQSAYVEQLQKLLAFQLGTDSAATPVSQTTRVPGFWNRKYNPPFLVSAEYRNSDQAFTPADFPTPAAPKPCPESLRVTQPGDLIERARLYLSRVPPAIAGQHGDVHTFQACCRLVRGFCLDDNQAMQLLWEWNTQCCPPWTERELRDKMRRARLYGREPVGALV